MEHWWQKSAGMPRCTPPTLGLPQVKEASPVPLRFPLLLQKELRGLWGHPQGAQVEKHTSQLCPGDLPLTSVRPYVGLETVVILVLLATDSTLIGPWKTGKEGTGQLASQVCNHEAPGPTMTLQVRLPLRQWAVLSPGSKEAARTSEDRAEQETRRPRSISGYFIFFFLGPHLQYTEVLG